VGKWLNEKAPDLLETIGESFPPVKLLANMIDGRNDINETDKATFKEHLQEYQMDLDYHAKNTENARGIYSQSKDITDSLANKIMNRNLPFILALVIINILCVRYLDSALLAIVSNVIGMVMQKLFEERSAVTNFFFGSSKGSKEKEFFLKKQ
jgi:hypothetical protein